MLDGFMVYKARGSETERNHAARLRKVFEQKAAIIRKSLTEAGFPGIGAHEMLKALLTDEERAAINPPDRKLESRPAEKFRIPWRRVSPSARRIF